MYSVLVSEDKVRKRKGNFNGGGPVFHNGKLSKKKIFDRGDQDDGLIFTLEDQIPTHCGHLVPDQNKYSAQATPSNFSLLKSSNNILIISY